MVRGENGADEAGEEGPLLEGLVTIYKEFGFYPECVGKPTGGSEQGINTYDLFLKAHFGYCMNRLRGGKEKSGETKPAGCCRSLANDHAALPAVE